MTRLIYGFTESMHGSLPLNADVGSRAQVGRLITPYENDGIGRDFIQCFPFSSGENDISNPLAETLILYFRTQGFPYMPRHIPPSWCATCPFLFLSFRDFATMLKEELISDTIGSGSRSKAYIILSSSLFPNNFVRSISVAHSFTLFFCQATKAFISL